MNADHWPPVIVTKARMLVDGFHRFDAAKKREDDTIEADIRDISEEEALALAAKCQPLGLIGFISCICFIG